jgi:protein TonB
MPIILAQAPPPPAAIGAPSRPSVITSPDWLALPTGDDLVALYPKEAAAGNAEGSAILACQVSAEGSLTDCSIGEETPPNMGFGTAALAMSSLFKMRPMSKD